MTCQFATTFIPDPSRFAMSFREILTDPAPLLLVAERADDGATGVVGYLLSGPSPTLLANGPVAWIEELFCLERHRRRGVGGPWCRPPRSGPRPARCAYIALTSRRARAFYRSLGFEDSAVYYRKLLPPAASPNGWESSV